MTNQVILTVLAEKKSQLKHRIQAIAADFYKGVHRTLQNKQQKTMMYLMEFITKQK